jgi:hypothetical protein
MMPMRDRLRTIEGARDFCYFVMPCAHAAKRLETGYLPEHCTSSHECDAGRRDVLQCARKRWRWEMKRF